MCKNRVQPPILANSKLKKKFFDNFMKELNVNKDFVEKNLTLLETYAGIKYELSFYFCTIPYEKLEYYRELKTLERKCFIHLHTLLNEKRIENE